MRRVWLTDAHGSAQGVITDANRHETLTDTPAINGAWSGILINLHARQ